MRDKSFMSCLARPRNYKTENKSASDIPKYSGQVRSDR